MTLSRYKPAIIILLSFLIFSVSLVALARLDYPTILFVRSLHDPLIEQLGNYGNRLGDGLTLVLVSIGLGLIGYVGKRDHFWEAGVRSLVAHAVAGIAVQIPKHLIGRPRPRLAHQEAFEHGMSFQSGLDAFPSGHSAATFAVAAVLARFFPRMSWCWYGLGSFVALSRFLRGSHFPTDVVAGAVLGFLVGFVCARPVKVWRHSLYQALPLGLPLLVGGLALFWVTFHRPTTGGLAMMMDWLGLLILFGGLALRWHLVWNTSSPPVGSKGIMFQSTMFIGLGMALTTHSPLVVLLACLSALIWWLYRNEEAGGKGHSSIGHEVFLSLALVSAMVVLRGLNGLIPLR